MERKKIKNVVGIVAIILLAIAIIYGIATAVRVIVSHRIAKKDEEDYSFDVGYNL